MFGNNLGQRPSFAMRRYYFPGFEVWAGHLNYLSPRLRPSVLSHLDSSYITALIPLNIIVSMCLLHIVVDPMVRKDVLLTLDIDTSGLEQSDLYSHQPVQCARLVSSLEMCSPIFRRLSHRRQSSATRF